MKTGVVVFICYDRQKEKTHRTETDDVGKGEVLVRTHNEVGAPDAEITMST